MRNLIIAGIVIALVYASCESTPPDNNVEDSSVQVAGDEK